MAKGENPDRGSCSRLVVIFAHLPNGPTGRLILLSHHGAAGVSTARHRPVRHPGPLPFAVYRSVQ